MVVRGGGGREVVLMATNGTNSPPHSPKINVRDYIAGEITGPAANHHNLGAHQESLGLSFYTYITI